MLIEDLPYFEPISNFTAISGAAGSAVIASALALGNSTTTVTRTSSRSRPLPHGGSLSISRGFGFARGAITSAQVTTSGYGDIVVGSSHSTPNIGSKPVDVAHGVVVAIVLPS